MNTSSGTLPVLALAAPLCGLATCGFARQQWHFVPTPGPGNLTNILYGVDGVGPHDVWAVGRADVGSFPVPDQYQSLAMHWDGATWSHVPTPNPGAFWNDLLEVVTFATDDVWAVGNGSPTELSQMMMQRWDGARWMLVPTPTFALGAVAWSMDGVSSSDLWVVGSGNGLNPLALHWNGSSWTVTPTPPAGNGSNHLHAAEVIATDDVWAVGSWRNSTTDLRPLIMRWNGNAWAIDLASFTGVTSPGVLRGVAAESPTEIWAVGYHSVAGRGTQPLIMHYNGVKWSEHPMATFAEGAAELRDVAVRGPDDVWAAGTHATDAGVPRPLIMHWDGVEWSVQPSVVTNGSHEWFRDIAAIDGGDVWAVGQYFNGSMTTTLAQRLPACAPLPGDLDCDGSIGIDDLLAVISAWGACPKSQPCPADLNGDRQVSIDDLLIVIANWGPGA